MKHCSRVLTFVAVTSFILLFGQVALLLLNRDSVNSSGTKRVFLSALQINNDSAGELVFSKSLEKNITQLAVLTTQDILPNIPQNSFKSEFMLRMQKRMEERKNRLEENCKKFGEKLNPSVPCVVFVIRITSFVVMCVFLAA